jgi:hypothetical protein
MELIQKYTRTYIEFLTAQNNLMRFIATHNGFRDVYLDYLKKGYKSLEAYQLTENMYLILFGFNRFESYEIFLKIYKSDEFYCGTKNVLSVQLMERDYLLAWFKSKGFDTWTSFSALVMHYYPGTVKSELLSLWKLQHVYPDVLKNVGYVKQIIGD